MTEHSLSKGALSILAFAAYHALASGEAVGEIVIDDGRGHKAHPEGLAELETAGLLEVKGDRARLTESGTAALTAVIDAITASQR